MSAIATQRRLPGSGSRLAALARTLSALLLGCGLLAGCAPEPPVRFFSADAYPARLSEWGIIRMQGARLVLADGVTPYDVNMPLFSDYAQKLRTLYLPPGTSARFTAREAFEFPVGTIVSKTFFYPRGESADRVKTSFEWAPGQRSLDTSRVRAMETRLLVRQADGWDALPYVWQGNDAVLKLAGALERLTIEHTDGAAEPLPYIVPTRNECAACHATNHSTGKLQPIGLKARHLNRGYLGGQPNQLEHLAAAGRLSGLPDLAAVARNAGWQDDAAVADKARAYLDANCGHCHNPKGAADTSGLMLDAATVSTRTLGICKPPIAAGQGTGGRSYSIVPGAPDASILVFRMTTSDPGARMPELGRSLVHAEGVELISRWIAGLAGSCVESGSR